MRRPRHVWVHVRGSLNIPSVAAEDLKQPDLDVARDATLSLRRHVDDTAVVSKCESAMNNDKNIFPREPILMDALGHRKNQRLAVRQPWFLLTFSHTPSSALSSRQCGRRRAYAQSTSVAQCHGSLCKARVNKPMVTASSEELCREKCGGTVDEDEVDLDYCSASETCSSPLPLQAGGDPHADISKHPFAESDFSREQTLCATFLSPRVPVPRQPDASTSFGGTSPNRRASHLSLSDGASQLGGDTQQRNEADTHWSSKHDLLSPAFRMWKIDFRDVARGANRPTQAMPWINEIEQAQKLSDLAASL